MTNQYAKARSGLLLRVLCMVLLVCMIGGVAILGASAEERSAPSVGTPTRVYLDGVEVMNGDCVIYDSITYVPLRKFCNLFDTCSISWNAATRTATVKGAQGLTLIAQQGALYVYANGHYFYTVGAIQNWNGSLYVPIRPLARAFDSELSWNAQKRSVELKSPEGVPSVAWASYKSDEVYWLARIISAESRGEPLEGQIAVGNVVLNRVRHKDYPNTIYGVIFDRKYGTQFSPVSFGTIYNEPSELSVIAAKICLEGYTLSDSILFFMNPRIATTNWIAKNRPYAFTIGNHSFYE